LLLEHLGAELRARLGEAPPDPARVLTDGEAREGVLELQRHRLDPARAVRLEVDEEEQPEIVPELRVAGVVVEEVAEVVEDVSLAALEDVRRGAREESCAGRA